jgi:hypothetical protein
VGGNDIVRTGELDMILSSTIAQLRASDVACAKPAGNWSMFQDAASVDRGTEGTRSINSV